MCPWELLHFYGTRRQMTLEVCMDPSTSSMTKSLCPVSLMMPRCGPIMCPIWLHSIMGMHAVLYFYHLYSAYAHIYVFRNIAYFSAVFHSNFPLYCCYPLQQRPKINICFFLFKSSCNSAFLQKYSASCYAVSQIYCESYHNL